MIQGLVAIIATLVAWFTNLSPEVQAAIAVIGGLIAAVIPLISLIWILAPGLKVLEGALSITVGAIVGYIAIAIAAIAALIASGGIITVGFTDADLGCRGASTFLGLADTPVS